MTWKRPSTPEPIRRLVSSVPPQQATVGASMVKPPRFPRPEMRALSPKQARRFLELAAESPYQALYVLALTTGMRQGELLGLRWSDLELEAARLSVVQTLDRPGSKPLFGEPKTRASRRRVLLTERAVAALRRHRVAQDAGEGGDQEGGGLAGPGLGLAGDVLALEREGQRPFLDRRGGDEARLADPAHQGLGQIQRCEVH